MKNKNEAPKMTSNMYRLTSQNYNPFLNYRHNAKQRDKLPPLQNSSLVDGNKIVDDWSLLAKEALEGPNKESSLVCWDGHYEQFGRLMYELYAISENRSERLAGYSVEFQNFFPKVESLSFIPEGPSGTEDRTFYRVWFKMLGHPDFSYPIIDDIDLKLYANWTYWLTHVFSEINTRSDIS